MQPAIFAAYGCEPIGQGRHKCEVGVSWHALDAVIADDAPDKILSVDISENVFVAEGRAD